ncbi:hypothetical protein LJY25_06295 [Hymenobacter sp. BT175]|uniref:hypothetical protein n=1 Tax=Hymenobacter translucens TaxID=2886507 RepID=UPI001D0E9F58|nr:hypothetical protein [Hymenobacter translucens]MCC2546048.1 hypothetical protein [Hymenobacter translucens]
MLHRYLFAPLAVLLLVAAPRLTHAQTTGSVGIGTTAPDASAALDIVSTSKGLLLPRVVSAAAIATPATGLLVYQTGAPAGFYYNSGTPASPAWVLLGASSGSGGDNLGNHTATQSLTLNGNTLSNNGTGGLRVDNSGNVGIGTASPAGPLQVNGERINAAGVGVDQEQGQSSGSDFKVGASQSFTAGSSNRLVRVEIGMHDFGAGQATFNLYQGAGTGGTRLSTQVFTITNLSYSSTLVYESIVLPTPIQLTAGQVYTLNVETTSGRVYFFFQSNNPYAGGTAIPQGFPGTDVDLAFKTYMTTPSAVVSVPALTVLPSTNVGIGTASPAYPLEVAGTVYSSTGGFRFPDGTTQTTAAATPNAILNQTTPQSGASFNIAGSGTIGGSSYVAGNVGIGTTSPTQKLDVRGNVRLGEDGNGAGAGPAIEWVGPGVSSDPVGIYRLNPAADQSELRVVVGDVPDLSDKFVVGRMGGTSTEGGIPTGTFTPTFSVSSTGQVQAPGLAGTGTRVVTADAAGNLATQALPADAQQLSISGSTLAISGGNSVTLPTAAGDNLGNHTATQALKLGTNALVGNGGTTGLSVTSTGDARLPAANAYTYAAAKTYNITYGISDVQPEQEGAGAYKIRVTFGSAEYVYATSALRIPVHLPQGATITGIKCYGQDTNASNDLRVYFISVLPADAGMGAPGSYNDTASSSGTPGYSVFSFVPTNSRIIDNNRAYYVLINAASEDCAFGAVRITYTVTQAE